MKEHREDYTLYSFGSLAVVLDLNGKLACVAICISNDGRNGGSSSVLASFSGRLYGTSPSVVRRRSEVLKAYKQG